MSTQVACPKCAGRLKMSRPPRVDTRVQCPRCGHPFVLPGSISKPQAIVAPGQRPQLAVIIGVAIALIAIVGIGIGAVLMSGGPRTLQTTGGPEKKVVAPKTIESKVEPQKKADDNPERLQEFVAWMIKAGVAEESKRLDDAVHAYSEALKLFPNDDKAKQRLQDLQGVLTAQANERKDSDKAREELAQLLAQAEKAMEGKQYAAAVEIYKLALQKAPADAGAGQGLINAQEALTRDQAEQKKLADFQNHLTAGKAAMQAGRYTDAIREFISAQQLIPNNAEAGQLQRQSEQQLAAIQNQEERRKQYQRLIDQATTAIRGGRFGEAELGFRQALQLMPNDALATNGLDEAQRGVKAAQAEFRIYMNRGNQAAREGRLQDAVAAFREAVRLFPADEAATKQLRDTETLYERQVTYDQSMRLAAASMLNQRYGDAVAAYAQAVKAAPGDQLAAKGLLEARQFFEVESRNKVEFERLVQTGLFAVKLQKYADANNAFTEALKVQPTHPQAILVQQQARYTEAMARGQMAMSGQRYAEAVQQFQLALQVMPNDFAALAALTRARSLNR